MADLSSFVRRVGVHFCPTCAYGRLHPGLEANHSPCNPCCFFLLCTARSLVTQPPTSCYSFLAQNGVAGAARVGPPAIVADAL